MYRSKDIFISTSMEIYFALDICLLKYILYSEAQLTSQTRFTFVYLFTKPINSKIGTKYASRLSPLLP